MERLRRGLAILKGSWAVLRGQPELMVLPIISTIAIIMLFGALILVEVMTPGLPKLDAQIENPWFYAALFLVYATCAFVTVFCNAALIYCAQRSFAGGRATLGEGLAAAAARWPQVLGWSIITATVGLLLKLVANMFRGGNNKLGFIATLIAIILVGLLDAIWVAVIYFVLPVLVIEGIGPFAAIKRSAELIRQRWGEVLVGEGGLGGIALLCLLPLFAIALGLMVAADQGITAVLIAAAIVTAVAIVTVSIVFITLNTIFVAGAYAYAISGNLPGPFGAGLIEQVFKKEPPKTPAKAAKPA